jgi:hypothetical protein
MGKFRWVRGDFDNGTDRQMMSTTTKATGTFTSSTSAAPVTGMSLKPGEIVKVVCDEDCVVAFGGATASTTSGHPLCANLPEWFLVGEGDAGAVSVIDDA